jgi:DNA repair protein RAD16
VQEDEEVDLDAMYGYGEMAEPPPELLMPLLPFQKQYLAWALKQVRCEGRRRGR